ncbi:MAG: RNA polymerase subunit sigma-70 [Fusobacteriia bacterium 4572_132]|nr:MAG: RNA polymerase subunit sigma-70 [Fusobacteriia bacterium 4572_132]
MYESQNIKDELIKEAQSGDEEALGEIFTQYKSFVYLKARNYFLMGGEKEDLIQEGMIGLLKAIRSYDNEKLASFKTFASVCIKRQLITAIKSASSKKHMILNRATEIVNEKNEEMVTNFQQKRLDSYIFYNPEEIFFTKNEMLNLQDYLELNLSKFEFSVFKLMIKGYGYTDIAEKVNKKIKSIDNAMQRIKRKSELWLENYKKN